MKQFYETDVQQLISDQKAPINQHQLASA